MTTETIAIVDRGRGPQLSTSRITVQDLVPYFQAGCLFDEIIRWLPTLSVDELAVAEQYYLDHRETLDELDRRVREHRSTQMQLQESRFPKTPSSSADRIERMKQPRALSGH